MKILWKGDYFWSMNTMKKCFLFLLTIGVFACTDDTDTPTPQCIEDLLTDFQTTAACEGDNLASWNFQGDKVYCFAYGTCTSVGIADIYDENCTLICTMGGTAGLTTCNGVPWEGNATNEQTIWTK